MPAGWSSCPAASTCTAISWARRSTLRARCALSRSAAASTFATGYKYAGMGYTTAFDAAIPPLSARHAHEEFHDTPCIDKGFYILMGNNQYLMRSIQQGEQQKVKALVGWLLSSSKSYAAK